MSHEQNPDYQPIENYGVIGDLHTVALVGMNGSIDFMCFPRFDSPSLFAALLDHKKGGHFLIQPLFEDIHHKQLYLPDTNVLLTRFLSEQGVSEISDFMPIEEEESGQRLVRQVKTVRGEVRYKIHFHPRFDYARSTHRVERIKGGYLFCPDDESQPSVLLRSDLPLKIVDDGLYGEFTLCVNESASFIMEEFTGTGDSPAVHPDYASNAFKATVHYWRTWVAQSTYTGRWREMVNRSALVLKLLTSKEHGSTVAAATFGLPEAIGGVRNWDYRYTWIRDAAFTLYGLIRLGFTEEAGHFMKWIEKFCACHADDGAALEVMYGIDGRKELPESILDHFEGYRKSSPVRIGNAAHDQLQLDIYGELIDSVYLYDKYGEAISYDMWQNITRIVNWVCENWERPDEGIWEVRGGKKHFLYSRVMCWVAIDRAIRLAEKRSFPGPIDPWRKMRDRIYNDVFENFWNDEIGAFVQHKDCKDTLDAANLLMPLVRFISPTDPRWLSTLKAIEKELVDDSLVHRYKIGDEPVDGLPGKEGTFCMCSFWNVECLSRAGDLQQARFLFEKMLGYANHVGLYAEELGSCGEHLGNFPQAFTHLSLISAAYDLNRRLGE